MLKPDERAHLLELLRPPPGCQIDLAVGTTFSLDLLSALVLPLSFAFFDWEHADGQPAADPLAVLEALRRYGDRFTIFCQSGQMHLPVQYQPLITLLEPCIYDVLAPDDDGIFHPKIWVLRFKGEGEAVRYRVLCLSRNLTFDRCWDTVVSLDGELTDRQNAFSTNRPLSDFVAKLPDLAVRRVDPKRRRDILQMAKALLTVRFDWPEGFDEDKCRFHVAGLDGRVADPFGDRREKALIVSPFLSNSVVRKFLDHEGPTHLISRIESLRELPRQTLLDCESVHFLQPQLTEESNDEIIAVGCDEALEGLHAKIFVVDHGWETSVFSGSFNATSSAFKHNVEFMVELVGKKSRFGVDRFRTQVNGETNFADLLEQYDVNIESPQIDPSARLLDDIFRGVKRALASARPSLFVTPAEEEGVFDMRFEWKREPVWPKGEIMVHAWPITQHSDRAQLLGDSVIFRRLSYVGITPLIAFAIAANVNGAEGECVFVMNLQMEGAPEDRQDRVLASLIGGRDQLLRYILFLLAAGDENAASAGNLAGILTGSANSAGGSQSFPFLLESMLRALHRSPAQIERVSSMLESIKKAPNASELLSAEFQSIWEPIWESARKAKGK